MNRCIKNICVIFKKTLCSKWFYCCLLLMILNLFTIKWALVDRGVSGMGIIAPIQLMVEIVLAVVYFFLKRKQISVEKIYWVLKS